MRVSIYSVNTYIYTYKCIHTYVCICIFVCIYTYIYVCIYVYTYNTYTSMYVYTYTYMYMYMCLGKGVHRMISWFSCRIRYSIVVPRIVLQCVAVSCSVLQCVAVCCCSVLQRDVSHGILAIRICTVHISRTHWRESISGSDCAALKWSTHQ